MKVYKQTPIKFYDIKMFVVNSVLLKEKPLLCLGAAKQKHTSDAVISTALHPQIASGRNVQLCNTNNGKQQESGYE